MPLSAFRILALYTLISALSIVINLSAQMLSMLGYKGANSVELSILVGTVASFPLRFLLEKRYIFNCRSRKLSQGGEMFVLYGGTSMITTLIFWGIEYSFHLACGSDVVRYVGAIVGLGIGFYVKYLLDKKYVFAQSLRLDQQ